MNALKQMEAVFLIALSAAGAASYLAATSQDANAMPAPAQSSVQAAPQMAVVTVVAKRMTPAEKAQSLREESANVASQHASR